MKKKEVALLIGLMAMPIMMTGCNGTALNVINDNVVIEYGKEISLDASDYLDNKDKVLKAVEVKANVENEAEKDYPAVGEYVVEFSYKKQNAEVTVSVVDTTKPEFVDFKDTVDTYQNSKVDFESLYTVDDLSGVEVVVDDSKVDYATVGTYTAVLKATDEYGNSTEKEVTVNVKEVTVTLNTNTASVNVGGTTQLEATTNVEGSKAKFTSSDSAIATVDENGLVTGLAKGSATITAEVNGIKAECVVTVNAVKTTSNKNSGSTNKNTNSGSTTNKGTTTNNSSNTTTNNSGSQTTQQTATPKTSREAFDLINAERVKLGLQPAVWSSKCEQIALQRGAELAQLSYVNQGNAHSGFQKFQASDLSLGECVAWGYSSANGVVNGWMNSTGHRDSLMSADYVYLAVVQVGSRWVAINSWSETPVAW